MNFVDSLNILGVEAKQIPTIILHGAPSTSTEGAVGLLGMDIDSINHDLYKCVAVNDDVYTWEPVGGVSGDALPDVTETDNGKMLYVVDGAWQTIPFPAGAQYDTFVITIDPTAWTTNGDGDIIYAYTHTVYLDNLSINVSLVSTPETIAEAGRTGVYLSEQMSSGKYLVFHCLYDVPTIALSFNVEITKPTTLSYSLDEEALVMTIVEG